MKLFEIITEVAPVFINVDKILSIKEFTYYETFKQKSHTVVQIKTVCGDLFEDTRGIDEVINLIKLV